MKNMFLDAVSHELRTPLASVLGITLTLGREDVPLSVAETRDLLDRLTANAKKLDRLLSDLLDLDRLARGIVEPNRKPTDVGDLPGRALGRRGQGRTDRREPPGQRGATHTRGQQDVGSGRAGRGRRADQRGGRGCRRSRRVEGGRLRAVPAGTPEEPPLAGRG